MYVRIHLAVAKGGTCSTLGYRFSCIAALLLRLLCQQLSRNAETVQP